MFLLSLEEVMTSYEEAVETLVSDELDPIVRDRNVQTVDRLKDVGFLTLTERGCFGSNEIS